MGSERGVQRWAIDISVWDPSLLDFSLAMSSLPHQEHISITRYVKLEDRKRSLVSRLLQYALIHQVLGIPFDEIIIKRTIEGKPYLVADKLNSEFPNFNFNVSHHGDYVAIASEPICLVGVDIVLVDFTPGNETVLQYISNFSSYFSTLEWDKIVNAGSDKLILDEFYRYWSLKEAFVKAIGTGVGYRLDSLEFPQTRGTNIVARVDGQELQDWKFQVSELGRGHTVCVAKGHPSFATESYKRTLNRIDFEDDDYSTGLNLADLCFEMKTVDQLIPFFVETKFRC